jgi:hypothetical protein
MDDHPADFGTGLRAHLGLEVEEPVVTVEPVELPEPAAAAIAETFELEWEQVEPLAADPLETLATLQSQLLERERALTEREATLAGRAGSLLAATQALYDEVLRGSPPAEDDELARLRRRKTVA